MNKIKPLQRYGAALFAVAMMASGCSDSSKSTNSDASPAATERSTAAANHQPKDPPSAPKQAEMQKVTHPSSVRTLESAEAEGKDTGTPVVAGTEDEKRDQAANMIYAQIRLRMEEFIAERKKLLDAGTPRTDGRVHQLEGSIQKARELLLEAGEMVEPVEPPL